MENLDIRIMVSESGLHYKDIAQTMDVTPEWLSRLLKKKLTQQNKVRIIDAIENLKGAEKRDIQ